MVSSERPIYFFGFELDKATPSLLVTAQQKQTLAHGGGQFRAYVCISDRSSGSVCAPRGPRAGKGGGGFYLLLLGWDPAPHRDDGERRKLNRSLLLHVWGSKTGEESKGGSKCEEKHQPTRDSVHESGLGGGARSGQPLLRQERYHLPNLCLTLITSSVTQTTRDTSSSPFKHTVVQQVPPPHPNNNTPQMLQQLYFSQLASHFC